MITKSLEKKLPKLSKKQKGFVADYVLTENGLQSALKNYDTENIDVAKSIATENLTKPYIQQAIDTIRLSYAERFKDEDIFDKHQALLNKKIWDKEIVEDEDGNKQVKRIETDEIDTQAVKAGLDMYFKIKGSYVPEKESTNTDTKVYNFYFDPDFQKNIKGYEDNLKKQILNAQKNKTITQDVEVIE